MCTLTWTIHVNVQPTGRTRLPTQPPLTFVNRYPAAIEPAPLPSRS
jgi:hypothetical protein